MDSYLKKKKRLLSQKYSNSTVLVTEYNFYFSDEKNILPLGTCSYATAANKISLLLFHKINA